MIWNTLKIVAAETQPGEYQLAKELWEKFMINQENILISNLDGYTYIKNIFSSKGLVLHIPNFINMCLC